jgi:copper chaperone CopZ
MKRNALIVTAAVGVLCLATSAWAGGASCSGKAEGASKEASVGAHCSPNSAGASMTSGKQCKLGANNAVFSYAVPNAHCGDCVEKIQSAAMAQKGVLCAKVDLETHTAYVAGDKNLNQRAVAKAIKEAGFTASFKAKGPKVRAELTRLMAEDNAAPVSKKS